ncbi:hypothetical protein V1264_022284 [Littorina saxatilis]|uniref:NHR domain-containing protein n=1 Tax=Littorina saxatilis TaxID=31220 RepID=A0AAN9AK25_9CAEN
MSTGDQQPEQSNIRPAGGITCGSDGDDPRVGVMVTTKAELHLWVNGSDRGVIATTVPTPCFAFFELRGRYQQVSVLPPTHPS